MTADEILNLTKPEQLFKGNLDDAKQHYRALAKEWHPDHKPGADKVFAKINELYDEAVKKISNGTWETEGLVVLEDHKNHGKYEVRYHIKHDFELGHFYVGDDWLTYVIGEKYEEFVGNFEGAPQSYTFANKKMEEECSRYLPKKPTVFRLPDKRWVLRVKKTPDLLLLKDVISYYGGCLDPKHAAWVLSSLYNLGCYLSYAKVVHHNISPETYFVSPQYHSGALLGGWWYMLDNGERVTSLPTRTFDLLPWDVRMSKTANSLTDQELIRAVGREMLGDFKGVGKTLTPIPQSLKEWLSSVATGKAVDNYTSWGEVLKESFGARRFTKMELDATTLYAKVR